MGRGASVSPLQAGAGAPERARLRGGRRPVRPGRRRESRLGPGAARAAPRRCSSWATKTRPGSRCEPSPRTMRPRPRQRPAAPGPAPGARRRRGQRRSDLSAHGRGRAGPRRPRRCSTSASRRFVRGDRAGALSAWQTGLASGPPAPALQAQLLYWIARAMPAARREAQDALNQAAAAAPESYYGLRAQEQLGRRSAIASSTPATRHGLAGAESERGAGAHRLAGRPQHDARARRRGRRRAARRSRAPTRCSSSGLRTEAELGGRRRGSAVRARPRTSRT